jgi:hypothetical protein
MREWASLTPEQRTRARDAYREFNQLPSEQKQAVRQKWEAYATLPADERDKVRQTGKSSRLLSPAADTKPVRENPPESAPAAQPGTAPVPESSKP